VAYLPFDAIHTRRCRQEDAVMSVRWPPHRRLPPSPIHHCANYASIKSTATPLCYLHSYRKIQWSRADSLLMPSNEDDVMVVNTIHRWTTDPRLHTITYAFADLKSESADGGGPKIWLSTHRRNDRRESLLSPTAPAAHSEDVHVMRSIFHCSASAFDAQFTGCRAVGTKDG